MDLQTARTILEHPERAVHRSDFVLAQGVLADHWRRNPGQLKPMAPRGAFTTDAVRSRKPTHDQARRMLRLNGSKSDYAIATDADGSTWVVELEGSQTGRKPPPASPDLMEADPPLKMPGSRQGDPGVTGIPAAIPIGDLARHRAATAARDRGATFAAQFNQRQRERWGQA